MKTTLKFSLAAIIAASAFFSSCGKYEEGPKISLASKKSRIARTWTFEKWIDGATGTEVACTSSCDVIELKKDGTYSYNGTAVSGSTWAFSSDKEKLEFTTTVFGTTTTSSEIILRLTSKELWTKDIVDGDQSHYVAK